MSVFRHRFAIELDGMLQELEGDRLRPLKDLSQVAGDAWLVSDFEQAATRVMRVETQAKYAEMVARKQIQDSGEFDEPVRVLTHWKRNRSRNTSEIYFTAVPESRFLRYQDRLASHPHNLLLFPLHSLLWSALQSLRGSETVAIVFAHDRFVDLLLGTRGQAFAASRLTAFANDAEAIDGLWNSVGRELELIGQGEHLRVNRVLGFQWQGEEDAFQQRVMDLAEALQAEGVVLPAEDLRLGEQAYRESLPHALATLRPGQSVSPLGDRLRYQGRRMAPWLLSATLVLCLALGGAGAWLTLQAEAAQARVASLQSRVRDYAAPSLAEGAPVADVSRFARELVWLRNAPAYSTVVNDISGALRENMRVDTLKVEHSRDGVEILLLGHLDAGFRLAKNAHQSFLAALRRQGYQVVEQQFTTSIQRSDFMVKLRRGLS